MESLEALMEAGLTASGRGDCSDLGQSVHVFQGVDWVRAAPAKQVGK